jgi:AraC family transcriptional regulator, regulatory protein of adaptative response / DNA-3-methyladenine glycosylase II
MPQSRGRALVTLGAALASGEIRLDAGADREEAGERLVALPGIGPWTAGYIRMRALSDPDVFLEGDVGVARALRGLADGPFASAPAPVMPGPVMPVSAVSSRWHPWRSYAVHHLWAVDEPPASPAES